MTVPMIDEAAAAADGVDLTEPAYEDYFGFDATEKWHFPDRRQFIEFKKMNEGDRKRYQSETRSDLVVERSTGNARMKADPATERWTLLQAVVVDWNVYRSGKKVAYGQTAFTQWLGGTDPTLVDSLEKAVRKANPWLLADMSVADIDKEIENLQEMREVAVKREQGEGVSSGK